MMKPIIGIVSRNGISDGGNDILITYSSVVSSIAKSGGIPIGISNSNISDYYNICDGFVFQGGDLVDEDNLEIIRKLNSENIPVLGICLGMQEMAVSFSGNLIDISSKIEEKNHDIMINRDSLLYRIVGADHITVNSRHKSVVSSTNLSICAVNGKIIEAIEDGTKRFFLGLQWHPENLYDTSIYAKKIFDYFIKMCHH